MGRNRKKPTNRELTEGIMYVHQKLDNYFITHQTLFKDFVEFLDKRDDFQKFLEDKYDKKSLKEAIKKGHDWW